MKEELCAINVKGEQRGNITVHDVFYVVGEAMPTFSGEPSKVERISMGIKGDRIFIYLEDGSRITIGYDPLKIDLFYRPIQTKKKDGEPDKESNEG